MREFDTMYAQRLLEQESEETNTQEIEYNQPKIEILEDVPVQQSKPEKFVYKAGWRKLLILLEFFSVVFSAVL